MKLYPAIDLKNGACVRLKQGRMEDSTVFDTNPAIPAKRFADAGCDWLHLVDLDGAFAGEAVNAAAVKAIRAASSVNIQLGGGIRNLQHIERWLEAGISRVILGTVAVTNPTIVREACQCFAGHIAVGIDTRADQVATEGWAKESGYSAAEIANRFADDGVSAIIHTSIDRDGMMQGPDLAGSLKLAEAISIPVIVSGGVSSIADLQAIRRHADNGIAGAIMGRALYEGLDVAAARNALEGA